MGNVARALYVRGVRHRAWSACVVGGVIGLAFAACSDGGTGASPAPPSSSNPPPAGSTEQVVYVLDRETEGVFDLYRAGSEEKLTPPQVGTGVWQQHYALTLDKAAVVYVATQDRPSKADLYRVELNKPGVSTKLNAPLGANGDGGVSDFQLTPDGAGVVYGGSAALYGPVELYYVEFAKPGVSRKISAHVDLGYKGDHGVQNFRVTPDGLAVAYKVIEPGQTAPQEPGLFRVLFAAPEVATRVTYNPGKAGGVDTWEVTADSSAVVYRTADGLTAGINELYRVPFASPGVGEKLNAPLAPGTMVESFQLTSDGTGVVYMQGGDLYSVRFASPGKATQLNLPRQANEMVFSDYAVTPDGKGVVYRRGPEFSYERQDTLHHVFLASPGNPTSIVLPLDRLSVQDFQIAPDSRSIVYQAQLPATVLGPNPPSELYHVMLSAPGVSQLVSTVRRSGDGSSPSGEYVVSPDSSAVLYRRNQSGVAESQGLFRVPFASNEPVRLSPVSEVSRTLREFVVR